jgi:hypothetical protein
MKLIEQIDDLIKQATTERSHHYVASTLLLCRDRIAELETDRDFWKGEHKKHTAISDQIGGENRELQARLEAVRKVADTRSMLDEYEAAYIYSALGDSSKAVGSE